jgi:PAS domain S-box-containing protein
MKLAAQAATKTFKVLLIISDPAWNGIFRKHLDDIREHDFELTAVPTLADARKKLEHNLFDVVFTGLNLPDGKGIFVLQSIFRVRPSSPVIVITEKNSHEEGLKAMKMGAENYLISSEITRVNIEKSLIYSIGRQRLSSRLIDSERRFRHMFEYSSMGIFRSTASGNLVEVNSAFAGMFGYAGPDDVVNKVSDLANQLYVSPDVRHKIIDDFRNRKSKYQQIEVDFYRKDGSVFTGLLHMRCADELLTDELLINDFLVEGYVQDITDKKKADDQIRSNLQFLKDLMDNIPSPVFAKDKDLKYTGCNKEFEKFIGFTEQDILGRTVVEVRPDAVSAYFHSKDQQLLKEKKKQEFEYRVKFADGQERDVIFHKNVIRDQHGRVRGVIGLMLDISEKKQALEQLREESSLNKAMAELSRQLLKPGISIREISNLILNFAIELTRSEKAYAGTINQDSGELRLYNASKATGQIGNGNLKTDDPDLIHETYPELWAHALNTLKPFYTNSPKNEIGSSQRISGRYVPLENFLAVPAIINGRLVGQIALANSAQPFDDNDLEGVKKLTNLFSLAIQKLRSIDELIHAKEKAEMSDKLKSAFLSNMSHEIRTPLNAIVGFAQMLGEEGIGAEETSEFKDVIIKNTDLLLRLISDIIEMAMIEAGELKLHSEIRSVDDVISQVYDLWRFNQEATEKSDKINFIFQPPKESTGKNMNIDSLRFSQIMDNLLLNAFRFTREGEVKLGYHLTGDDQVKIFVEDTGIGIAKEDQASIFERFRQVDELKVRPFSGTGLGLAITKKLVERLSGHIEVKSEPGKGSVFIITFPIADSGSTGKVVPPKSVDNQLHLNLPEAVIEGKKLLVVEDNDSGYEFLEILLKRRGALIDRAVNGREAVEKALQYSYDIVLMDLQLPEMSGFDATKKIRETNKELPIIVQTAFSEQNERDKAFEAGCNYYLIKPITKQKLEEAILKFC